MNIDWNKYFEKIYVYSCAGNFDRREHLNSELSRIGCNNYEYFITCKDDLLVDVNHYHDLVPNKSIQITHGEYLIIKTAYELGYNNILLFEDDISFLKDVDEIYNQLEEFYQVKDQYNIYLFDYLYLDTILFLSSALYLDRKGMEYMIYCIEHFDMPVDCYFSLKWNTNPHLLYFYFFNNGHHRIEITLPENIQPISINISKQRICIQSSTNYDTEYSMNVPDKQLYNQIVNDGAN